MNFHYCEQVFQVFYQLFLQVIYFLLIDCFIPKSIIGVEHQLFFRHSLGDQVTPLSKRQHTLCHEAHIFSGECKKLKINIINILLLWYVRWWRLLSEKKRESKVRDIEEWNRAGGVVSDFLLRRWYLSKGFGGSERWN